MTHDDIEELLGVYALDAVEPEEARQVEAHLAECPRCQAEVEAHRSMAAMLAAGAGGEAPKGLWERIASSIAEDAPSSRWPEGTAPSIGLPRRPAAEGLAELRELRASALRRRQRRRAVLGAGAALAAGVAAFLGVEVATLHSELNRLEGQVASASLAQAAAEAAASSHVTIALTAGGRPVATVLATPSGGAYWLPSSLAKLPPSETYQLWGLARGKPVSLALVGPDPRPVGYFRLEAGITELMVTAEPRGGTPLPTTAVLAAGTVPRGTQL